MAGTTGFLGVSLALRVIEAMTFSVLKSRSSCVYSVKPQRVSNYFSIGKKRGQPKGQPKGQSKKTKANELVKQMLYEGKPTLFGNKVTASEDLLNFFGSQKKKDDLSDSLLQAVALLDWSEMAKDLYAFQTVE